MANLYNKFCDQDQDYFNNVDCDEDDDYRNFLVLPLFGYFTMLAWVINLYEFMCVTVCVHVLYG